MQVMENDAIFFKDHNFLPTEDMLLKMPFWVELYMLFVLHDY